MRSFKLVLFAFFCLFVSAGQADKTGWVSTGGEIFLYARNPWFVRNVDTVNYCIQLDSSSVTASIDDVRAAFKVALQYWKQEMPPFPPGTMGFVNVATQEFKEQAVCDDTATDLRIKVGYGTLTPHEIDEYLKDPTIYVGVGVRTEYDTETLKGKGFIYISSDKGPHAYSNKGELITEAWQYPKLLQYALIHEMGHVFGIPHTGAGVMSEIFLNQVIHKRFSTFYLNHSLQPFLSVNREFEICDSSLGLGDGSFNAGFFMLDPAKTACMKMVAEDVQGFSWKVFSSASKTMPNYVQVGTVKVTGATVNVMSGKPAVILQLPPEQKVFGPKDYMIGNFLIGPLFTDINSSGFFETMASHKPYPLQVQMTTDSVTLVGTMNGKITPVLVFSPPSLLKMIVPIQTK